MPLRSLMQVDFAEHSPDGTWNILCPGPSLEQTASFVDPSRPTIAINAALRAPVPVSFWASWGPPTDTTHGASWDNRGVGGALHDARWVITSGPYVKRWRQWLARKRGVDAWIVGQHKTDPIPEPWKAAGLDLGPSWLLAVRTACLRGGAKRIHLFGLDLAGDHYAYGAPDPKRRDLEDWEGRWIGERVLLTRLAALLSDLDVELVQVEP